MSKTFCVLPWLNITTHPNGSIMPCCVSKDFIKKTDGTNYNLGTDTIEDIYNSPDFVSIRSKMLNGLEVEGCKQCYNAEKHNGKSHRLYYNNYFKDQSFTNELAEIKIQYFDLRFGNLCNLSCKSCSPGSSSTLSKEVSELNNTNIHKYHKIDNAVYNWYEGDMFEKNINSQLENISYLYLTGGEPTIIDKNVEMLEKLVESNASKNITLQINSNLTNLKPSFIKLLEEFLLVRYNISIDGYADMQEYLRYPSKWSQIDKNLKNIINKPNFKIIANPVIQATNLNKIVDLFEYFENINKEYGRPVIEIMPIILTFPSYLNLNILPYSFRKSSWEKIESWIESKCKFQEFLFKVKIQELKSKCLEEQLLDLSKIKEYIEYNSIFDIHRNLYLKDINLELHELLESL